MRKKYFLALISSNPGLIEWYANGVATTPVEVLVSIFDLIRHPGAADFLIRAYFDTESVLRRHPHHGSQAERDPARRCP